VTTPTRRFQPWPIAIVTVLLAQMLFGVWMARLASSDPHFAVEPDYYARAVNWDETMSQSRRDRALGWRVNATIVRASPDSTVLRIAITDSTGAPVMVDSIVGEALAVAHAAQINTLRLERDGDHWTVPVPHAVSGLWEIRLRAVLGAELFTSLQRVELK